MTSKEVLITFLKLNTFPIEELTAGNKKFLERYSIDREKTDGRKDPSANDILKSKELIVLNEEKKAYGETDYYNRYPYVRYAKDLIKYYYDKYNTEKRREGFNTFKEFIKWWNEQGNVCHYCEIDAATSGFAFRSRIFRPKKDAWKNGVLQIEKKNPNGIYKPDNCVLACPLCNNAKSDMITSEEFIDHFAEPTNEYWQYITKDKIEHMQEEIIYFSSLLHINQNDKAVSEKIKQLANDYKLPQSADSLFTAFDEYKIPYNFIKNTNDIWIRDFMPVKTKSKRYVSFRYEPWYLEKHQHLRTGYRKNKINDKFPLPIVYSKRNLDGGNVVFSPDKNKVIISRRVFEENYNNEKEIVHELERLLEAQVIIIPSLPKKEDMTGHADGMVRFVDEKHVIGNKTGDEFEDEIKTALKKYDIEVIDFPFHDPKDPDGISAIGCYLNLLETKDHIFLPVFGIDMDYKAIVKSKEIFNKIVIPININEIAKKGGGLNCISWEM